MSNLFEGDFQAKAVKPEFGADSQGRPKVRVEMEIVEGERKGTRVPYDGKLDEKNIRYTKRHMLALGWQGKDIRSFVDDVIKAGLVVPIRTRVATYDRKDGKPPSQWTSVQMIGTPVKPLAQLDGQKVNDVNDWFATADATGAGQSTEDNSDVPF